MQTGDPIGYLVIALVFCFGIFLLLREFFCWYLKINRRIDLQKQILRQLQLGVISVAPGVKTEAKIPLTEGDLIVQIKKAKANKEYDRCKAFCSQLLKRFPKSIYAAVAQDRLNENWT